MTTFNNPIYVSFHIGRGGHYHNPGYLTFVDEEDFQQLIDRCLDKCFINTTKVDENGDESPLDDEDWTLTDEGGNPILEGREEMEAMTGRLEWDNEYDTDYVTSTDKLSDGELDVLWDAYKHHRYMSEELKDEICSLKDLKRVHYIKTYPSNLELHTQEGVVTLDFDHQQGVFTEDEWREQLEDEYCPESVDEIIDALDRLDIFSEGEDE